ncbi:MAG: hypothetical protein AVO38_03625 [delta proteobacterium ML8_D]|nr:MAG: hypothetical protein AVO38_03625 [delta proteobacterium ML8_D]
MQQKKNALHWFMCMVETGAINPTNPDLSLVPADILSQIALETVPDGELQPTQTAVTVAYFLFISAKIAAQIRNGSSLPQELMATRKELYAALDKFLTLVELETLRRAGLLNYQTTDFWHDDAAEILISDIQPLSANFSRLPSSKLLFNPN